MIPRRFAVLAAVAALATIAALPALADFSVTVPATAAQETALDIRRLKHTAVECRKANVALGLPSSNPVQAALADSCPESALKCRAQDVCTFAQVQAAALVVGKPTPGVTIYATTPAFFTQFTKGAVEEVERGFLLLGASQVAATEAVRCTAWEAKSAAQQAAECTGRGEPATCPGPNQRCPLNKNN